MTAAEDLFERFAEPDKSFGPVPIWWWSGAPLENDRLRWQMEQLSAQGVHQAVIMCLAPRGPIFGSVADSPPFMSEDWWSIFARACADAEQLGFRFWLYDQLGFSGANFQGQLVTADPELSGFELRTREIAVAEQVPASLSTPEGSIPVGGYFVGAHADPAAVPMPVPFTGSTLCWQAGAGRLVAVYAVRQGFDYFSRAAGELLVDTVLGEFERRVPERFGSVIVGLFQDELPNMPTWSGDFLGSFAQVYGYNLAEHLGLLWEDGGRRGEQVRHDYHALRASLGRRGFFEPLAEWTARTGVTAGFDQQSPAREGDPVGGVALYGDYLQTHRDFAAPGSDHWGDSKVHSSLAHAQGHPRTWLESFHSSGWGGTLEETYDWLAPFVRRGVTLYDPHAVYYATVAGWWEWAPPSTCWRQPYWPSYHVLSGAVSRLCSVLTVGDLVADTVLLHPTVTAQAALTLTGALPAARASSEVYHQLNGVTAWFSESLGVLDRAAIDYEIFDDATLGAAQIEAGALAVARGRFSTVILPAAATIRADLADRLVALAESGGTVVCVGTAPEHVLGDREGHRRRRRHCRRRGAAGPQERPLGRHPGPHPRRHGGLHLGRKLTRCNTSRGRDARTRRGCGGASRIGRLRGQRPRVLPGGRRPGGVHRADRPAAADRGRRGRIARL